MCTQCLQNKICRRRNAKRCKTQNVHLARLTNILIEFAEGWRVCLVRRVASLPIRIPNRESLSLCTFRPYPHSRFSAVWDLGTGSIHPHPRPARSTHSRPRSDCRVITARRISFSLISYIVRFIAFRGTLARLVPRFRFPGHVTIRLIDPLTSYIIKVSNLNTTEVWTVDNHLFGTT